MKEKTLYIILLFLVIILVLISVFLYIRKKNGKGISLTGKKPITSILFIGDSNTNANFSYADVLRKQYPGITIKKIAQDGAKTDWMLGQLQQELNTNTNHYDVIAILGGSNDIYALNSNTAAKSNLDAMYRLAHSKGSKVLAVTPPNKKFYTQRTPQKETLLIDLVSWISSNTNKDYFVDWHKLTDNQALYSAVDGYLHPQAGAHIMLADQVTKKLDL
jgi:hypothetical protein